MASCVPGRVCQLLSVCGCKQICVAFCWMAPIVSVTSDCMSSTGQSDCLWCLFLWAQWESGRMSLLLEKLGIERLYIQRACVLRCLQWTWLLCMGIYLSFFTLIRKNLVESWQDIWRKGWGNRWNVKTQTRKMTRSSKCSHISEISQHVRHQRLCLHSLFPDDETWNVFTTKGLPRTFMDRPQWMNCKKYDPLTFHHLLSSGQTIVCLRAACHAYKF